MKDEPNSTVILTSFEFHPLISVSSVLLTPNFCARREDFGCARRRAAQFSPALGAARARGIGGEGKCGRGGGRHRSWRIALLLRIQRCCPGRLRGRKIGDTLLPRARATPSAGLGCGARLRAHPGDGYSQVALG